MTRWTKGRSTHKRESRHGRLVGLRRQVAVPRARSVTLISAAAPQSRLKRKYNRDYSHAAFTHPQGAIAWVETSKYRQPALLLRFPDRAIGGGYDVSIGMLLAEFPRPRK